MKQIPLTKYLPGVSRLTYGCMGLGGDWSASSPITETHVAQANEAIDAALTIGINLFDHADIYTRGKAEQVFGQVLKSRPALRDDIYIQTKCAIRFEDAHGPKRYDFSRQWIIESVDKSLARLRCDYIDVLLLHRPDPLMEPEEVAAAFDSLKSAGKVKYFGVSNMHGSQVSFLQSFLDVPLVANQIELSLRQQGWIDEGVYAGNPAGRHINFTPGTLEYARLNDLQIQSWGSLCQGIFTGNDLSGQPAHVRQTAALVAAMAERYEVSREAIVLGWLLRHPAQIQAVIGTTNPERIAACGGVKNIELSREDWYALYVSAHGQELP